VNAGGPIKRAEAANPGDVTGKVAGLRACAVPDFAKLIQIKNTNAVCGTSYTVLPPCAWKRMKFCCLNTREGNTMWRVVALCWIFLAPTLAGVLVLVAILTPALAPDLGGRIVYAAVAGAILAVPAAIVFAKTQARGLA
jgi:hypothetical protein